MPGLASSYKKTKKIFFFLLLVFIFFGPFFIFITRSQVVGNIFAKSTLERFFLSSYLVLSLLLGLGLAASFTFLSKLTKSLPIIISLIFILPLLINYPKVDQSKNFLYEEFGRKTFELLPQNAVLFMAADNISMISKYLQIAKQNRPDLKILNLTMLPDSWYKENMKQKYPDFIFPYDKFIPMKLSEIDLGRIICQDIVPNYPTYIEQVTIGFDPANMQSCSLNPVGHLVKLEKGEYKVSINQLQIQEENFWQPLQKSLPKKNPFDLRTRTILLKSYSEPRIYFGTVLERADKKDLAQKIYLDAFKISPDNAQAAHRIAQSYFGIKDFDKAIEWSQKALKIDPRKAESYRLLGLVYLNGKKDQETAKVYLQKFLKLAGPSKEKETIKKLIQQL